MLRVWRRVWTYLHPKHLLEVGGAADPLVQHLGEAGFHGVASELQVDLGLDRLRRDVPQPLRSGAWKSFRNAGKWGRSLAQEVKDRAGERTKDSGTDEGARASAEDKRQPTCMKAAPAGGWGRVQDSVSGTMRPTLPGASRDRQRLGLAPEASELSIPPALVSTCMRKGRGVGARRRCEGELKKSAFPVRERGGWI